MMTSQTNWLAGSWDIGTLQGAQLIVEIPSRSEELHEDTSFHFHLVLNSDTGI